MLVVNNGCDEGRGGGRATEKMQRDTTSSTVGEPGMDEAPFYWTDAVARDFPPAFVAFLKANDIHPDNYAVHDVPRYVRVSPRQAESLRQPELERQLGAAVEPVEWLPGYFSVPSHVKIAGCDAYKAGQLYGIDVSSGAAVAAIDV